eukprot:gene4505-18060_t
MNAPGNGQAIGDGGCILAYRTAKVILEKTRFENCQAVSTGVTSGDMGRGAGGAIAGYSATFTVTDSVFTNNVAESEGGAICVRDVGDNAGTATFDRTRFWNNEANNGGGGGAIKLACVGGKYRVTDSEFVSNIAKGHDANGGAIQISGR